MHGRGLPATPAPRGCRRLAFCPAAPLPLRLRCCSWPGSSLVLPLPAAHAVPALAPSLSSQRAGPRLSEQQLLDHYNAHTKRCSICQSALRNVRLARALAAAVGAAAAAVGAAALVAQWAAAGAPLPAWQAFPQGAAAAGGAAAAAEPRLQGLAAACGVVAALALLVWRWCQQTIPRFYQGERPFARNRVRGEYAP